ncbi:hypothetical protein CC2G_006128 [Coprinopsis cinerea AmutBmut pab1-1]|nr:hypothetical protein CC2G_006128 [Coprinopsis cinerea AmutBmut pab1-1]
MQVAGSVYPASQPLNPYHHSLYHPPIPNPQDHDLKRQYLGLLPPQQIIEICLTFDLHVSPYIKSTIWPLDISAAIAGLRKSSAEDKGGDQNGTTKSSTTSTSATTNGVEANGEAIMDSLGDSEEETSPAPEESPEKPAEEPRPPDKEGEQANGETSATATTTTTAAAAGSTSISTASTSTNGTGTPAPTSAAATASPAPTPAPAAAVVPPPPASHAPAPTPTPAPAAIPSQPPAPPTHPAQAMQPPPMPHAHGYPHQPYGYPYPHTPYYPPPPAYPYSHPQYPPYPHHQYPQPPQAPGYPPPPASMYPHHPAPHMPPMQDGNAGDDLPSYEEMIVEALQDSNDPEGCAPKDLFTWMAARYPLQSNFRPSASQALQKAYKRGRLEKSSNNKYRLNAAWEGGSTSRRTTRRPQTHPHSSSSQITSSPFTNAPLVHHHHQNQHNQHFPPHPYGYPYSQTPYQAPQPQQSQPQPAPSTSTNPSSAEPKTTAPPESSGASSDAYEAAQNILKAINFGSLLQLPAEETQEGVAAASKDAGSSQLVLHQQQQPPQHTAPSGTLAIEPPALPGPEAAARAELQAQLALLAAQLTELTKIDDHHNLQTQGAPQPVLAAIEPPPQGAAQQEQQPLPALPGPLVPQPQMQQIVPATIQQHLQQQPPQPQQQPQPPPPPTPLALPAPPVNGASGTTTQPPPSPAMVGLPPAPLPPSAAPQTQPEIPEEEEEEEDVFGPEGGETESDDDDMEAVI